MWLQLQMVYVEGLYLTTSTGSDVTLSEPRVAFAETSPLGIHCCGIIVTWPVSFVLPVPIVAPSLSNRATSVLGEVKISIGLFVLAASPTLVMNVGLISGACWSFGVNDELVVAALDGLSTVPVTTLLNSISSELLALFF